MAQKPECEGGVKSEFIKNSVSHTFSSCYLLLVPRRLGLCWQHIYHITGNPHWHSPSESLIMPPKKSVEPRQIGTRASNKLAHPGQVTKTGVPRRTSAEVQHEREAKAKAKADREKAKKQGIIRAAEFEHADMANEDIVNATPRPPFTPKPWPPPRNKKKLVPVAESNEVDEPDFDNTSLSPAPSDSSVTESESESVTESESDDPTPPTKKQKIQATQKVGGSGKVPGSEKGRKVDKKVVVASEEEHRTSMPKKVKAKVRDEIDFAAKKMEKKKEKYRDIVSMPVATPIRTIW